MTPTCRSRPRNRFLDITREPGTADVVVAPVRLRARAGIGEPFAPYVSDRVFN